MFFPVGSPVGTALSIVISCYCSATGMPALMISNEVLRTALSTLQTLPFMSLSDNQKLNSLGIDTLQQVY